MKILLDTNVISELVKPNCNQNVKSLLDNFNWNDTYLSAFTFGELCYGLEKMPEGKRKHELSIWIYMKLPVSFKNRILFHDTDVFIEWGKLRARSKRTLPYDDSLLAAVALCHNMILVTRNTSDFEGIEGIKLINPWDE